MAEVFNSDLFQKNLLPYLEQASNVPYVQPKEGQTDEQYMFELRAANIKAGAYSELLTVLRNQNTYIKNIANELKKLELRDAQ